MQKVLHETCQQYVVRRLSEGWKIVSQKGLNVVLQSPEGILRPVDLRNDVETLRPSAGGDSTENNYNDGSDHDPDVLHNFEQVDEVVADDDATYVFHVIAPA